ncbi:trypsin-like serine peptidase [Nocardia arizonensis]|uniref:trypsin-like serine peptidase n=1 Tax=Nocardia arizonensis TaxID=1141647 RepID=UPI0006CF9D75|nr:serine protease [Nocardia arizonensis]
MLSDYVAKDHRLVEEFLDRFPEILAAHAGAVEGLEGLEPAWSTDDAAAVARGDDSDQGLEAIIERFARPVYLVQDGRITTPGDSFANSEVIESKVRSARSPIEAAIPSVGRIDLRDHLMDWVGTGWVVAPDLVVTNRHVAREFAEPNGSGYAFSVHYDGNPTRVTVDFRREYARTAEARFAVPEVVWIEPPGGYDVAVLRITGVGANDERPIPRHLELAEAGDAAPGSWIAAVGFPYLDTRWNLEDQQRIFDGIYGVKRMSPGRITAAHADDIVEHDATTLGGSSGSALVDMESGRVVAIHFGADRYRHPTSNLAVSASRIADIVHRHAR